jgi:uncharacterized protein involved in cysteine biosynthesis
MKNIIKNNSSKQGGFLEIIIIIIIALLLMRYFGITVSGVVNWFISFFHSVLR